MPIDANYKMWRKRERQKKPSSPFPLFFNIKKKKEGKKEKRKGKRKKET